MVAAFLCSVLCNGFIFMNIWNGRGILLQKEISIFLEKKFALKVYVIKFVISSFKYFYILIQLIGI